LKLIEEQMLPAIEKEKLADYLDVFCEEGFFSKEETIRLCRAGIKHGLKPKIHANQLNRSGGVQAGIEAGAISVDHLESMGREEIDLLSESQTIGTLLPSAAFFLRMNYPPAREMIEAGCAIAIASDYNPGSSPGGNMEFVISLSCIQMKMFPEEALNAATINGACAMEIQSETGSIHRGKRADLLLTKEIPSLYHIPYTFSETSMERMMLAGQWQ
jgi:imidazolonepropionase